MNSYQNDLVIPDNTPPNKQSRVWLFIFLHAISDIVLIIAYFSADTYIEDMSVYPRYYTFLIFFTVGTDIFIFSGISIMDDIYLTEVIGGFSEALFFLISAILLGIYYIYGACVITLIKYTGKYSIMETITYILFLCRFIVLFLPTLMYCIRRVIRNIKLINMAINISTCMTEKLNYTRTFTMENLEYTHDLISKNKHDFHVSISNV